MHRREVCLIAESGSGVPPLTSAPAHPSPTPCLPRRGLSNCSRKTPLSHPERRSGVPPLPSTPAPLSHPAHARRGLAIRSQLLEPTVATTSIPRPKATRTHPHRLKSQGSILIVAEGIPDCRWTACLISRLYSASLPAPSQPPTTHPQQTARSFTLHRSPRTHRNPHQHTMNLLPRSREIQRKRPNTMALSHKLDRKVPVRARIK